ncbi:Uncharacterized protein OS=Kribbella flavida (strain DSM 17836 / JCM 10339 / NBRC 14399) GN=Kfla_0253 PE=4 SV=1: DUF4240 [Gemmata massiliana]|uniref:DUF4240 domain-containing protein n=1 Tax=Gemmata massiliana TaxID=1210884 RepID=A0A6P2D5E5_9BACT|nr:DUF4240 domain-containing protein [Gemmata massiliana]VTR95665.1 Uncharacterized protein OS=Kribbella flavida (strain DSM 17836 / JCM 10339 / NBRC 14399) GN=Kfla_0253 PE=4 SV=1: DUF4240 [Gemmata massiliana]
MTLDEFWDHIQKSKRKDPDAHAERLEQRLAKLPPDEILDFGHWWELMMGEAYHWNLWGAAYLINGGCSDDGFEYFCRWLVLRGRDVFQAAVTNPDTLANVVHPDDGDVECGCSPAQGAWFTATKTEPDDAGYEAYSSAERARHPNSPRYPELGAGWDFDDDAEMRKRLPHLSALYMDGGAGE